MCPRRCWAGGAADGRGRENCGEKPVSRALKERKPLSVPVQGSKGKFPRVWLKVILPIALFDTTSHFLSSPIFLAAHKLFPLGCSANKLKLNMLKAEFLFPHKASHLPKASSFTADTRIARGLADLAASPPPYTSALSPSLPLNPVLFPG